MRKLITLLLVFVLVLALCGCKGKKPSSSTPAAEDLTNVSPSTIDSLPEKSQYNERGLIVATGKDLFVLNEDGSYSLAPQNDAEDVYIDASGDDLVEIPESSNG